MATIYEDAQSEKVMFSICGVDVPQSDFKKVRYTEEDFRILLSLIPIKGEKDIHGYFNRISLPMSNEDFIKMIKEIIITLSGSKDSKYRDVEMSLQTVLNNGEFKFVFRVPFDYVPLYVNGTSMIVKDWFMPWRLKIGK